MPAGLWLESLDDVFQSVVFPAVPRSSVCTFTLLATCSLSSLIRHTVIYGILFGRKFAENLAYLFFLTSKACCWMLALGMVTTADPCRALVSVSRLDQGFPQAKLHLSP